MADALQLLERVPSVLVFLFSLTIVAECADATGVFQVFGRTVVRASRGRVVTIWLFHVALSALVTAFLSLDTTAVLMTSAAVVLARSVARPTAMFAFPTLWLANMGSLWLPVSNLTNLLAHDVMPVRSAAGYAQRAWPLALTATVVPLCAAALVWRRDLAGRSPAPAPTPALSPREAAPGAAATCGSPPVARASWARRSVTVVVLLMCVAILVVEPAVAAAGAAAACLVALAVFERPCLRRIELPWRSLTVTIGLFAAVAAVHGSGVLRPMLDELAHASPAVLAVAAALTANATNNLPTYLALEPAARGDVTRLLALLVGVNVASGITWWGSVATLLWRDRLRRAGEIVTWRRHLALTGAVTLVTTLAVVGVLQLSA